MRRSFVVLIALIALIAPILTGLSACGGGDQPAAPSCVDASGTWDMGSDGRWTIAQSACNVTLTAASGLFGDGGGGVAGAAGPTGFSASWTLTDQRCRTSYQLDAAVSGATLRGTLHWVSYAYGNGDCPSAGFLTRDISGRRL